MVEAIITKNSPPPKVGNLNNYIYTEIDNIKKDVEKGHKYIHHLQALENILEYFGSILSPWTDDQGFYNYYEVDLDAAMLDLVLARASLTRARGELDDLTSKVQIRSEEQLHLTVQSLQDTEEAVEKAKDTLGSLNARFKDESVMHENAKQFSKYIFIGQGAGIFTVVNLMFAEHTNVNGKIALMYGLITVLIGLCTHLASEFYKSKMFTEISENNYSNNENADENLPTNENSKSERFNRIQNYLFVFSIITLPLAVIIFLVLYKFTNLQKWLFCFVF